MGLAVSLHQGFLEYLLHEEGLLALKEGCIDFFYPMQPHALLDVDNSGHARGINPCVKHAVIYRIQHDSHLSKTRNS